MESNIELCLDLDEMKRLVNEIACLYLKDLTNANIESFVIEALKAAKSVLEKYVFSIRKVFTNGDFAIKDLNRRESFTNYKTGYQHKMLDWIKQNENVPKIRTTLEIPSLPQGSTEKKWHRVSLGIGTAGAVGFEIGRRCMEGERYWIGILIELVTLVASYFIYKKKKALAKIIRKN